MQDCKSLPLERAYSVNLVSALMQYAMEQKPRILTDNKTDLFTGHPTYEVLNELFGFHVPNLNNAEWIARSSGR